MKENGECWREIREGIFKGLLLRLTPKGCQEANLEHIWGKSILGGGKGKFKGPEAKMSLHIQN